MWRNERIRLVAEMLKVPPESIPWQPLLFVTIEFETLPQFDNAVLTFVKAQQSLYQETATAFVAQNLMTPAEAQQALPELELHLSDVRGGGAIPIRTPPNLPTRVIWSSSRP